MRKWYVIWHLIIKKPKIFVYVYVTVAHVQVIDIEQMIQERLQKIERLKYSLELQKVR